jgi:hypothetical protein
MTAPPQQYNEVRRGDQICSCPACQRILYHQSPAEESENGAAAKT